MTGRLFAILAFAACLPFAGCTEREWPSVWLEQNSVTVSPSSDVTSVGIKSGSGSYRAEINDHTVANVRVERTDGAGIRLFIEPKSEGDAVITVTDNKSGHYDRCSLRVARYISSFSIEGSEMSIDADHAEEIEAALKADTSIPPIGGFIRTGYFSSNNPDDAEWAFTDADRKEIAHGTFSIELPGEINPIFGPMMPQVQMLSRMIWVLTDDAGGRREFDRIVFDGPATRLNMPPLARESHVRFFEDLTEQCQREFPDAGVRSVARAIIANPNDGY